MSTTRRTMTTHLRTRSMAAAFAAMLGAGALIAPAAQAADDTSDPSRDAAKERIARMLSPQAPNLTGPQTAAKSGRSTAASGTAKGTSAESRAAIQGSLDAMTENGAVGVTARVDSPSFTGSFSSGKRELDEKPRATTTAQFRAASNTKMMISTLAMQQVEAGNWTLQTTIDDIAPGLVPGHGSVTIEQLLSHRSGMPDGLVALIFSRMEDPSSNDEFFRVLGEDFTDQQIIDASLSEEWLFEPGTDFSYSNAGYVVLGQMLEKQTGQPIAQLMHRDVFKPARMGQSYFATKPGLRANSLVDAANMVGTWYNVRNFNPALFSSAGAVVSTTKDLNTFTDSLITGQLVDASLVEQMKRPRSFVPGMDYGLGVYRIADPCTPAGAPQQYLYGHDGATFGTLSFAFTSEDGTRQVSMAYTGRYYVEDPTQPPPFDPGAPLLEMIKASC